MNTRPRRQHPLLSCFLVLLALTAPRLRAAEAAPPASAASTVYAEVVALDQPFMFNRLGAAQPSGMIFALRGDVVSNSDTEKSLKYGEVMLRPDKRPRPLVLRVNVGQYLEIKFTNLLAAAPTNPPTNTAPTAQPTATYTQQPSTRSAGLHITGLELVSVTDPVTGLVQPGILSDATWVGRNPSSLAEPGDTRIYKYYAKAEGTYLIYSGAGDWNGQTSAGMFGAATVEPANSEWYRSQITHDDLQLATRRAKIDSGGRRATIAGQSDISLTRKERATGEALTVKLDGVEFELWSFSAVETERLTVHKTEVVVRDGQLLTPDGRPIIDYDAVYPPGHPRAGLPILRMTRRVAPDREELIANDLTAIVTGPGGGEFPFTENGPGFYANPTYPSRRQPFREITVMYHEVFNTAVQAFAQFNGSQPLSNVLGAGADTFAINYGASGIGAEVLASRLGVGPMGGKESVDLKFEEFFLSSWACGDPAMVVDVPANAPNQTVTAPTAASAPTQTNSQIVSLNALPGTLPPPPPQQPSFATAFQPLSGAKATKALYPDDPSNVYHSYMRDHVTMRLLHTGTAVTHVHHLHAHQWLRSPNSDDSHYLDSQMIAPGSTYTLEMVYNGSGNRNETVGDAIFHCHFYPHFAGGMWALWRIHDVFEAGTRLDTEGRPVAGWNRALPDAEIAAGTPIPAIVPLPSLAMAIAPAPVKLIDNGRRVEVAAKADSPTGEPVYDNPGYPFFVPGVAGHRAPHPPIDFAWEEEQTGRPKLDANGNKIYLDGGLPRHQVLDGTIVRELHTRWDFSKDFIAYDKAGKPIAGGLVAFELPEEGTAVEKAAMATHAQRAHASFLPNGDPGNFILNGLPPAPGAPYANPSVDDNGNGEINTRRYQGAAIQLDVTLTKQGWHYPQQRVLTLWQDVAPTISNERAPQPLFFRANTGETIEFWHTNLVPDYYDLDDFQVRTPTDIIGQHIHLVKFDVTSSDGAGNGWNYEDGTFSPDEVRGRIDALNLSGGIYAFDPKTQFKGSTQRTLTAKPAPTVFGSAPAGQNWTGAQTTIQRWDTDPVENNQGEDRTLRTVFTHDHFGPSTHQQVGLYGGLLVEPQGSKWHDPVSGGLLYDTKIRQDGGPTSWQADIITANPADSYREFALEFADFQLAYTAKSPAKQGTPSAPLFTTTFTLAAGPLTPATRATFLNNGIPLADNAALAGSDSAGWLLTSAVAPGVDNNYKLTLQSTAGTYAVYPQNLAHGWSAPEFALAPPSPDPLPQNAGAPYPTLISTPGQNGPGGFSLNYRAEPVPPRTWDPKTNATAPFPAGDLSYAYASIPRSDPLLNQQPVPGSPIDPAQPKGFKFPANIVPTFNGPSTAQVVDQSLVQPTDPFTPMLRAYAGDKVQIRTLVGAHHNTHYFSMDGVKWLYEPGSPNTGYRNHQQMGISEHYEMLFPLPAATAATKRPFADYLYNASAGTDGVTNGLWGLMRSYKQSVAGLKPLPNNIPPAKPAVIDIKPPKGAKVRRISVVATSAQQALKDGVLVYNSRGQKGGSAPKQLLQDPYGLLYVRAEDLDGHGKLKKGVPVEPLILRAAAGEWIELTLINKFSPKDDVFSPKINPPAPALSPFGAGAPAITLPASTQVGLNPQVLGYDITKGDGLNVGFNPTVTVAPGKKSEPIYWYAGTLAYVDGRVVATPVEFGAINLNPSDPLQQHTFGLVGALVIEPEGSTWVEDKHMRAAATVTKADGKTFRDFVMLCQDDLAILQYAAQPKAPPPPRGTTTPVFSNAVNYGTEPMNYRFTGANVSTATDVSAAFSNSQVGGLDPQTPVYTATVGSEVRFRMLHPASGGGSDGETLTIDGHVFQEEPYANDSRTIAFNPLSQWFGTRGAHGARDRFEAVLASAGGDHRVPGDYLYRSTLAGDVSGGTWGVFRVTDPTKPALAVAAAVESVPDQPTTQIAPAETPTARRFRQRTLTVQELEAEKAAANNPPPR